MQTETKTTTPAIKPIRAELNVKQRREGIGKIESTLFHINTKALASHLGVVRLAKVQINLTYQWQENAQVHIEGTIAMDVTQTCGRSLKEIEHGVEINIYRVYQENKNKLQEHSQDDMTDIDSDIIDYFHNSRIDVGSMLEEEMVLAIDPYFKSDIEDT